LFREPKSFFRRNKGRFLAGIPAGALLVFLFGCCSVRSNAQVPERYGADYYFTGLNAL
jgi:hypothetical protein